MASIKIVVEHPALAQPAERVFNLADADLVRVIQAAKVKFRRGPQRGPNGATGDEEPLTNAQALTRMSESFFAVIRQMTHQYEAELAAQAAANSVTAIEEQT